MSEGQQTELQWQWARFDELGNGELYRLLQARQNVFIVEQRCAYPDADGLDPQAWHLLGWRGAGAERELLACARILPPGLKFAEPAIGRVLTTAAGRGQGLGRALLHQSIARLHAVYPGAAIRLSAQCHLQAFYRGFGFSAISSPYDEDGIPHIDMLRPGTPAPSVA